MRKPLDYLWGGIVGVWLAVGMYTAGRYGVWALAWFAGGVLAVESWKRGSWWLRCRSYRRFLDDERWDDDALERAA